MGYLDNKSITVDAIITKKGREKLAKGDFSIVKFALADDEIDYTILWDENHPKGSEYYGSAIENMPLLEASPDENQSMKYNLVTLPKITSRLPIISAAPTDIVLLRQGQQAIIVPNTSNGVNNSYTATLHNSSAATISAQRVLSTTQQDVDSFKTESSDYATSSPYTEEVYTKIGASKTAVGTRFLITALNNPFKDVTTQVSITGNDTGGSVTVTVTIKAQAIKAQTETL